jgi:hypothetical protein
MDDQDEPERYKDKLEDHDRHRTISMKGSPIPTIRSISTRFLSALEGIIEVGDASR